MAEEENENEEKKETEESTPKGGSKKKLLFIIGGVVALILLIGTPVAFFTLFSGDDDKEKTEQVDADAATQVEQIVYEGYGEESEAEENEESIGAIYPMETFVVNLKDGGYLRCTAQVEFKERTVPRKFYTKLVPIRDSLIMLLSGKTRDEINSQKGKGLLKGEIRDSINQIIKREEVNYVYFTEFVIQ